MRRYHHGSPVVVRHCNITPGTECENSAFGAFEVINSSLPRRQSRERIRSLLIKGGERAGQFSTAMQDIIKLLLTDSTD